MNNTAYYLPALPDVPTRARSFGAAAEVMFNVPELTPALLDEQLDSLVRVRENSLLERPVLEIVSVIDRVAGRLIDPLDPLRRQAVEGVALVGGLSTSMAAQVLTGMARDWRREPLERLLRRELGEPRVLDEFVQLAGTGARSRAFGPKLTFHVFSGNVPGVAVTSLIRSLLLKSATFGKTAAGEPLLPPLFARALAEDDPELGACFALTYWPGGTDELETLALRRANAVIAYGGAEAIASLRRRTPSGTPFLAYGQKVSFGLIAREALESATASQIADDAALAVGTFDQQGCVSPHLFYVEEGGEISPERWGAMLAESMQRAEERLPRGKISPSEAVAIRQARSEAEFAQFAGRGHKLFASYGGTVWTVIFDPDPSFVPSCLNRLVRIKPVASLEDSLNYIPPLGGILQTVALEGPPKRFARIAAELARLGASRFTSIGRMAWPPPEWHHDGRPPLLDLVRWCDWE